MVIKKERDHSYTFKSYSIHLSSSIYKMEIQSYHVSLALRKRSFPTVPLIFSRLDNLANSLQNLSIHEVELGNGRRSLNQLLTIY